MNTLAYNDIIVRRRSTHPTYLKIHLTEGDVCRVDVHDCHGGVVDVDVVHVEGVQHVTLLTDVDPSAGVEEVHLLGVAGAPDDGVDLQPVLRSSNNPDPVTGHPETDLSSPPDL